MWLAVLASVVAVNGWLMASVVTPYATGSEPEYLVLLAPLTTLVVWWGGSFGALVALRAAGMDTRRLMPILLLVLPPAAIALLATPLRQYGGPWLYLGIDLRPWLLALVTALIAAPFVAGAVRARAAGISRWHLELAIAAVLAAASLVASPRLRFQSVLVGDEPKYLRYLENWYRGRGVEVSELGAIADLPAGSSSNIGGNLTRMDQALRRVATDLTSRRRGTIATARPLGGWFVEGVHGGRYQVHSPGMSLLLFPGYVIDRWVSTTQRWHPQFPTDLYATNLTVLMLWIVWSAAVFRLLSAYTGRNVLSALITTVVFLSLPVTAFAYQYYPEVAAGLGVALLARYALLASDTRRPSGVWYGAVAGFLPWLHVRFLPLTAAATIAVVLRHRRKPVSIAAFACGATLSLVALAVYTYHITGSGWPWAMYALTDDTALFSAARAWRDLPALWLDRTWGLVAQSPIYLVAVPGVWLTWRRSRSMAIAIGVAVLLIAVPAAGHGYTGAFTTPLRLVAAVLPLLAIPMADAVVTFGGRRWFAAAATLAAVMSVQNGLTYNVHLVKSEAFLQGATTSGWMFPLLLPDFSVADRLTQPLTVGWMLVTVALLLLPLAGSASRAAEDPTGRPSSTAALAGAALVIFALAASLGSALGGLRFQPLFAVRPGDARDRVIHFALTHGGDRAWSSERGGVDVQSYFPEPADTVTLVTLQPERPRSSTLVQIALEIRRPGNRPGWGTASVDFGDGSPHQRVPVEETAHLTHTYSTAGDYALQIGFELWGLPPRSVMRSIRVN